MTVQCGLKSSARPILETSHADVKKKEKKKEAIIMWQHSFVLFEPEYPLVETVV